MKGVGIRNVKRQVSGQSHGSSMPYDVIQKSFSIGPSTLKIVDGRTGGLSIQSLKGLPFTEMPSFLPDLISEPITLDASQFSAYDPPHRPSNDKSSTHSTSIAETGTLNSNGNADGPLNKHQPNSYIAGGLPNASNGLHSLPNGRTSENSRDKTQSRDGSSFSITSGRKSPGIVNGLPRHDGMDQIHHPPQSNGNAILPLKANQAESSTTVNTERSGTSRPRTSSNIQTRYRRSVSESNPRGSSDLPLAELEHSNTVNNLQTPNRYSSPPIYPSPSPAPSASSSALQHPGLVRLQHRHTLQVPKVSGPRGSRDFSSSIGYPSEDAFTSALSPTVASARRGSLTLVRRTTRSLHSDLYVDEIPQEGEVARWTETVRQKRASRRQRKEEEEDDRVMVGTKVDINHVNWITAYNMLTGIRFTVSRTNAKLDRELTDQDFDARHKFSFDITGNELTPSAKYDFKFKDYAPWVFRHLRAKFKLDPADYLISLTSKYILSELGSPGKSGSFFYFSRDYKYIIKTIHHAEHKLLRKILREYYAHIEENPNTLISQFYGLHRVKIPYGRKIHFVVMNNLFPPHRDIHQTFDLKGSTIGRNFKEEDLERNPRATLKDLNWLRRNYHLEFGSERKKVFIEQLHRDVALLQKLKIMDYSLLVGIHDLNKGNEENLRDKTLRVFQPGGERSEEPQQNVLTRTPSKLENARKARELRQIIKREKPVPMDKSTFQMPEEILEDRKSFLFYGDDGGFRATHDNGQPGEEIYYLGVIDCLTHYGFVKRAEHFWKGMSGNASQISPIPPEPYGDRFVKFITGITMAREAAEKQSHEQLDGSIHTIRRSSNHLSRSSTDRVIEKAEKQAKRSEEQGASEDSSHDRTLGSTRSPSAERTGGIAGSILPVVEEAGEGSSGEHSARSGDRNEGTNTCSQNLLDDRRLRSPLLGGSLPLGGKPPPTPPKDFPSTIKPLPCPPLPGTLTHSPTPMSPVKI